MELIIWKIIVFAGRHPDLLSWLGRAYEKRLRELSSLEYFPFGYMTHKTRIDLAWIYSGVFIL